MEFSGEIFKYRFQPKMSKDAKIMWQDEAKFRLLASLLMFLKILITTQILPTVCVSVCVRCETEMYPACLITHHLHSSHTWERQEPECHSGLRVI